MKQILPTAVALMTFAVASCSDEKSEPASNRQDSSTPAPAAPSATTIPQPAYELTIVPHPTNPAGSLVEWIATVNSGGWSMRTEQATVEEVLTRQKARIYIVLEAPGPGDMVTQAIETLKGSYESADVKVQDAELSSKVYARGSDTAKQALFGVVKRAKAGS